jgi:hypothetical protein
MQFQTFVQSISDNKPPKGLSVYLNALWHDAKGDWHEAHSMIDHLHDETACWVHAYLHRKEGDLGNADYWYRRAGKERPSVSVQDEWEMIAAHLLR